ncbi:MAG: response regulator [Bryobacterales bacterium]|nr:response regulator [Bryobacterales bacterium]
MLFLLGASLAGFAANLIPYPVTEGVDMLFGGVFSYLVALTLGPLPGAVAALFVYLPTVFLWGHPYGVLAAVLEATALGSVAIHRKPGSQGDVLFWVALVTPLPVLIVVFSLPLQPDQLWAITLKCPLNSILNVALAVLLSCVSNLGQRLGLPERFRHFRPLRMYLLSGIILTSISPLILVIVEEGRSLERRLYAEAANSLQRKAYEAAADLARYVDSHRAAMMALTASVESHPEVDLRLLLARYHALYPGFVTMLIAGRDGSITASSIQNGSLPAPVKLNVSKRHYFQIPMKTGEAFVSEAFRGVGFGQAPIVAVSAPLRGRRGHSEGIVEGSLALDRISLALSHTDLQHGTRLVLLDRNNAVVYASPSTGYKYLQNLTTDPMVKAARAAAGVARYQSGTANLLVAREMLPGRGWEILFMTPAANHLAELASYYRRMTLWAGVAIALSVLLAKLASGLVTKPLERVVHHLRKLAGKDPEAVSLKLPANSPEEILELARDFEMMSAALAESYHGMRESLDERMHLNQELTRLLSQLKARTAELTEARDRAEAASRAKSAFLTNISHEIRTPIHGLLGLLMILLESPLDEEQRVNAKLAQDAANDLLNLMNGILNFSLDEGGARGVESIPFVPAMVLDGVVACYQAKVAAKGLNLGSYADPKARSRFEGDPGRIREVLVHLVTNAIKFTNRGSIRVALAVKEGTESRVAFRFEVSDTGIGIADAERQRLFEPFTQADESMRRKQGGAGLGLAICRKLVAQLGGTIGVESKLGLGSSFWFHVTLAKCAPPLQEPERDARIASADRPRSPRVLIVEDNPINQKVARRIVEHAGYEVELASNGKLALDALEGGAFDAVLMDCQMPEMDGYEATARIRAQKRWARLPIIAVTAHVMQGDRERCLAAGMDDYIPKPVNRNELLLKLERWVRSPQTGSFR